MTAYIVELSREAYAEIVTQLPPVSRYVALGLFPSPHHWLLDEAGNIIVFTPVPVERLESRRLEGSFIIP